MKEKPNKFEWGVLYIFMALAIVIFYFRVVTPATDLSQLTTALLSAFEILFSLYVGCFLQRIDSARQFEESLKRYSFLAYRRIMDIKKSIYRSISQIDKIQLRYQKDKLNDLDTLRLILEGTFDTVESSISDWMDFIDEELAKKQKIGMLQYELQRLSPQSSNFASNIVDKQVEEQRELIIKEIDKLRSDLPYLLRNDEVTSIVNPYELISMIYSHFNTEAISHSCITLHINLYEPLTDEVVSRIAKLNPYLIRVNQTKEVANLLGKDGELIGEVANPFVNLITNQNFVYGLYAVLQAVTKSLSVDSPVDFTDPIILENVKALKVTDSPDEKMMMVKIPANSDHFGRG